MLVGVDEAGRGPVLGSMFVAAVAVPTGTVLPEGIVDSKQLSDERREGLAAQLREHPNLRSAVIEVSNEEIDAPDEDLNVLTARAHAGVIRDVLPDGAEADCTVDACDVDANRFRKRVCRDLPDEVRVDARHRADEDEPIVAAASIVAKSHREAHVAELGAAFGPIGSGYPSDPTTRSFLEQYVDRHGELPDCARQSWQTSVDVLAALEQGTLAEFED